ncbi:hypothetical protein [Clostridium beijerinckii]|uniref:hypothetical protein n=1 Tax=Clostridium beijerinckii TaxID=1520 RepID=UPI00080A573D|nr:hypothetical protein [Clostridium beijerinckii]OCA97780.1 hypothetical protein BGS1_25025 [Clostridium beijerinckii]
MERRLSLLFGIIGGWCLILLNSISVGNLSGYVTSILFDILLPLGQIFIVYFSILLIIDAMKTVHKK